LYLTKLSAKNRQYLSVVVNIKEHVIYLFIFIKSPRCYTPTAHDVDRSGLHGNQPQRIQMCLQLPGLHFATVKFPIYKKCIF